MELGKLFLKILTEQQNDYISFPEQNFNISVDKKNKKIIFYPEKSNTLTNKIRTILVSLKQNFNVSRINSLEDEGQKDIKDFNALQGIFEVELKPQENMDTVIDYLKQQAGI